MGRGGRKRGGSSSSRSSCSAQEEEEEITEQSVTEAEEEPAEAPLPRHTDGRIILQPSGVWFKSQTVVRAVTASYLENLVHGVTCWTQASDEDKEMWFNIFRKSYYWTSDLERIVWQRYNEVAMKRFKDNMYKVSKMKSAPSYMKGTAYEEFTNARSTPEFKERSNRARRNRGVDVEEGEKAEGTHYGGSQSFYDRVVSSTKKNHGELPSVVDLFLDTHAKKSGKGWTFANRKDRELYNRFLVRKKNNPDVPDNELWFDLVEGFQGGDVYGTGAAKELYFDPPPRTAPSTYQKTYTPGMVLQLQSQLAARDKKDAERDKREAERDEELRRMKEQMDAFNSFFANCNSGWRPQFKDPRDPDNGGGSGAGASFPVA